MLNVQNYRRHQAPARNLRGKVFQVWRPTKLWTLCWEGIWILLTPGRRVVPRWHWRWFSRARRFRLLPKRKILPCDWIDDMIDGKWYADGWFLIFAKIGLPKIENTDKTKEFEREELQHLPMEACLHSTVPRTAQTWLNTWVGGLPRRTKTLLVLPPG